MSSKRRQSRVAERVKEEASSILLHELKDPRMGFVTVTSVRMSPDLQHAHIYVSVLGEEGAERSTMRALQHARGFVQRAIAERVQLRRAPEIQFHTDESTKRSVRISSLIRQIHEEENRQDESSDAADGGSADPEKPSQEER